MQPSAIITDSDPGPDARGRGLQALQDLAGLLTGEDPEHFAAALCERVAELVGARRVLLFLLQSGGTIAALPGAHGVPAALLKRLRGIPCVQHAGALADAIVYDDRVFRGDLNPSDPQLQPYMAWLQGLEAPNGVAVAWRAGHLRHGLVAAFDAAGDRGFSAEDEWVLQVAAVAAGLVWQQRRMSTELLEIQAEETDRIRTLADRMTALEHAKTELLNLAAHELRGPLAIVRGYLSMIQDGSLAGPQLLRLLPTLVGKATQMEMVVTQMLETARLEEGLLKLDLVGMDLGRAARQAVDSMGLLAAPGQFLTFDQPSTPVLVRGDSVRIGTILTNLLDNALKYSPDGGSVRCSVRVRDGQAEVQVRDRGLGIAPADMDRLFTRFGRILTPENSHIAGTGLGLHLCRALARMHGGDIDAESALGRGSTFTLQLPLDAV